MEIIPNSKPKSRWDGKTEGVNYVDPDAINLLRTSFEQARNAMGQQSSSGFSSGLALSSMISEGLSKDMQERVRNLQSMGGGQMMGAMAFGVGENEKGKKVARAAKMTFDPATGEMKKDFVEKQLEPDDVQLPKETVENYDTTNCIEVELEEAPQKKLSDSDQSKK
jgi:hypothetical protein